MTSPSHEPLLDDLAALWQQPTPEDDPQRWVRLHATLQRRHRRDLRDYWIGQIGLVTSALIALSVSAVAFLRGHLVMPCALLLYLPLALYLFRSGRALWRKKQRVAAMSPQQVMDALGEELRVRLEEQRFNWRITPLALAFSILLVVLTLATSPLTPALIGAMVFLCSIFAAVALFVYALNPRQWRADHARYLAMCEELEIAPAPLQAPSRVVG
jgi:hypothetical protein